MKKIARIFLIVFVGLLYAWTVLSAFDLYLYDFPIYSPPPIDRTKLSNYFYTRTVEDNSMAIFARVNLRCLE